MSELRILSSNDVKRALPMTEAIEGMKEAYSQLSAGRALVPLRSRIDVQDRQGATLIMPSFLMSTGDLAVKIVSVFPENPSFGKPVIHAAVLVLDAETGRPLCLLEGGTLTAVRTGAASGAATDILARTNVRVGAIIGSGVQARTQLEAICTVRQLEEVRIYSLDDKQAAMLARDMAGRGTIPESIITTRSASDAIKGAEIICTATTSQTPVFKGLDLDAGVHVNAIGSFMPGMQEVDSMTILRSKVFVDSFEAALEEAGDLLIPLEAGEIDKSHIRAELGQVINGDQTGRESEEQITCFKSVGVAVQDAVAGRIAYRNALREDLGTVIHF